MHDLHYQSGFNNEHETEAEPGALPVGQFSPQQHPLGLYAEQLSTTAFTAPRHSNRRTWCYRIQPSVSQSAFKLWTQPNIETAPVNEMCPHQALRWSPEPDLESATDFVEGLTTIAANGDARTQVGLAVHWYQTNRSMERRYFYSADGEFLFVPVEGEMLISTELGKLSIAPGEIAVIPRGIKFQANPLRESARGYLAENYGAPLDLPERGPVGANGFANQRDFFYPVAAYEDMQTRTEIVAKFGGRLFKAEMDHSPLNVVGWAGSSAPYKYDLARFNTINTVSFDHPDPSIFTVLTSPSDTPGVANLDFVIFPPRWMVAEHTFRPPWYHRNVMSEFMGLVKGQYDAKKAGFEPGGVSLHNMMTPHGPERAVFDQAASVELKPEKLENTLAFMFESRYAFVPTKIAMESPQLQNDYQDCWSGLEAKFNRLPNPE
jgi:homogentisate 1,2-dioxygenase